MKTPKDKLNHSFQMLESRIAKLKEDVEVGHFTAANQSVDMAVRELQLIDRLIEMIGLERTPEGERHVPVSERNPFKDNYLMTPTFTG